MEVGLGLAVALHQKSCDIPQPVSQPLPLTDGHSLQMKAVISVFFFTIHITKCSLVPEYDYTFVNFHYR